MEHIEDDVILLLHPIADNYYHACVELMVRYEEIPRSIDSNHIRQGIFMRELKYEPVFKNFRWTIAYMHRDTYMHILQRDLISSKLSPTYTSMINKIFTNAILLECCYRTITLKRAAFIRNHG